jgi:flagellar motor component MotA
LGTVVGGAVVGGTVVVGAVVGGGAVAGAEFIGVAAWDALVVVVGAPAFRWRRSAPHDASAQKTTAVTAAAATRRRT